VLRRGRRCGKNVTPGASQDMALAVTVAYAVLARAPWAAVRGRRRAQQRREPPDAATVLALAHSVCEPTQSGRRGSTQSITTTTTNSCPIRAVTGLALCEGATQGNGEAMQHHAQTGAIASAAATLAANLPDPSHPTIILFLAGVGALLGAGIGRIRRLSREQIRELAEDWSFTAGIIGVGLYLASLLANLAGRLHWSDSTLGGVTVALFAIVVAALSLAPPRR
jgi:hypothetical protein